MPPKDRSFLLKLSDDLGINHTIELVEDSSDLGSHQICLELDSEDDEEDEENLLARQRVLKKYDALAIVSEEIDVDQENLHKQTRIDHEFRTWKAHYYKDKLELDYDNESEMGHLIFKYVEGLQWILYYYYRGVSSWEWFFPYHYAPRPTDLLNLKDMKISFKLGRPFKPFEQLMGVLPAQSKIHIPEAFRV